MFDNFRFLIFFRGALTNFFPDHSSKINLVFRFVWISHLYSFIIFSFLVLRCIMGKEICRFNKNSLSKISTPTLKKPVLSPSDSHTSSASNSTQTYISSQLDNKYITTNQNNNNTSNIDDIHSCVTLQK